MTVRVVLADDHPMYRYGLTAVLEQADGIDVVASVGDGAALVDAVRDLSPDVVLTDLSMPGLDGVVAIAQLLGLQPELPILVLTMHEDDAHVFAALRAGARGYLVKGADGAEIVRAVYSVASGEAVYGGAVARRIVAFYSGRQVETPVARLPRPHPPRAGGPRATGGRLPQPRDRPTPRHVRENRPQPRLPSTDEAPGPRPHRRRPESPRIRDRPGRRLTSAHAPRKV